MSLGKVKDVIDVEHFGKLIRTHNDRFGDAWYLFIKNNAKYWWDFAQFVRLPSAHVNYWDSMKDDDVLEIIDFPKLNV